MELRLDPRGWDEVLVGIPYEQKSRPVQIGITMESKVETIHHCTFWDKASCSFSWVSFERLPV